MTCTRSTTTRRSRSALVALLCLVFAAPIARADPNTDAAKASLQVTVDQVLAVLNDKSLDQPTRLKKLEQVALDRFDFPRMTLLVLGKNRGQLSPEQLREFQEEFKTHLSLTYGKQIEKYTSDEKIEIGEARAEPNKDVTVRSKVVGGAAGDGLRIDYRLRDDAGNWKIIDVVPEGVSLIQNFRSQVQEIVTQKGVGQLIQTLRDKNASRQKQEEQQQKGTSAS
jgi:phospholipid transport system substrate-binding protein